MTCSGNAFCAHFGKRICDAYANLASNYYIFTAHESCKPHASLAVTWVTLLVPASGDDWFENPQQWAKSAPQRSVLPSVLRLEQLEVPQCWSRGWGTKWQVQRLVLIKPQSLFAQTCLDTLE